MFIYDSKIMVVRSSQTILFFKPKGDSWELYHTLNKSGFLFGMASQRSFQLTTDSFIYQYKLDKDFIPKLELIFYNFLGCSQIMLFRKCQFCITYKYGSIGFTVIQRKYGHTFLAQISSESFQNTHTLVLNKSDRYVVGKGNKLRIYD